MKLFKALAFSAILGGAALVTAPAQAFWWGPGWGGPGYGYGPGSGWGDGTGWGDFSMTMGGGARGYGYNRYNPYYGGYYPYGGYGGGYPYGGYGHPYGGYGHPYGGYGHPYGPVPPIPPAPPAPKEKAQ